MQLEEYLKSPPRLKLAGRLKWVVWIVTATVLILVGLMRQVKIPLPAGVTVSGLPAVHAGLNSAVAVLLCAALYFIKCKRVGWHRRAITAAMVGSALFLGSYVVYHFTTVETRFGGEGGWRIVYYVLLTSHIVLAAVSLPFILLTWVYGFTNQFQRHRRLARWVFPVWLYVSITGPICYLMLRPYYGH